MPITLTDEKGNQIDLDKADGGTLRKKLEEALKENQTLAQENTTFKAQAAIEANGLSLVKPEDLEGVALDEIETKAKELQVQKEAAQLETVKSILASRGLEGDALESAAKDFLAGGEIESKPAGDDGDIDFAGLGQLPGVRVGSGPNLPGMDDPTGNLTAAFAE